MVEIRWMELGAIGYVFLVVLGILPHNFILSMVAIGFLIASLFVKF